MRDTRPDFHHTPRHIERLERIAAANPGRRDRQAEDWLAFVAERKGEADAIEAALARGTITRRIVHGDRSWTTCSSTWTVTRPSA